MKEPQQRAENQINSDAVKSSDGKEVSPERREKMFQVARFYYEARKIRSSRCPYCGSVFTLLRDSMRSECPQCHRQWTPDQYGRLTLEDVAELVRTPIYRPSRSEVQRLLSEAEEHGVVRVLITRAPGDPVLQALEDEVKREFGLRLVRLVPGREELFEVDPKSEQRRANKDLSEITRQNIQDGLILSAAKIAAQEIVALLDKEADALPAPVLCVAWGKVVDRIVRQMRPTRALTELNVAPLMGAVSHNPFGYSLDHPDLYDSNLLAQHAAELFQCQKNAYWLPAPAFVHDEKIKKTLQENPLVATTLKKIGDASIAVFSIDSLDDPYTSILASSQLVTTETLLKMKDKGAIGDIAGHFFDTDGEEVLGVNSIGVSINDLKELVRNNRVSMAVIACPDNCEPLLSAVKRGFVSALVTDHITAQELLVKEAERKRNPTSNGSA